MQRVHIGTPARRGDRWPRMPFMTVLAMLLFVTPSASHAGASRRTRSAAQPTATARSAPFEPVGFQTIQLPSGLIGDTPVFTTDGRHLLFDGNGHLYIVGTDGAGLHCLTCRLRNAPTNVDNNDLISPFADGKRIFFTTGTQSAGAPASDSVVLECSPSILNCKSKQVLPVEFASSRPTLTPGGVSATAPVNTGTAAVPKISPDGRYIAFSDIRSDAAELMTVAKLTRTPMAYVTSDPKVINPPGPTSVRDTNTRAWSDSAALYEFKNFVDGGADATYVQVGGAAAGNPDIWEVNLATGKRWRLTSDPDWDEDNDISPDGRSLVDFGYRTMHMIDSAGALMPFRGFFDAPIAALEAGYYVDQGVSSQCILQPWLLPSQGDDDAKLVGQPLQPYAGGRYYPANNYQDDHIWNPQSTEVALTEFDRRRYGQPLQGASRLVIAKLTARKPTKPMPTVSSAVGPWAPSPQNYHGAIQAVAHVVLHGLASGTVTVDYDDPNGLLDVHDSATYKNYSDNGTDFINGTQSVSGALLSGPIRIDANLRMTGAHRGYSRVHLIYSGLDSSPVTVSGTQAASYEGTTESGPVHLGKGCPARLPHPPKLTVKLSRTRIHDQAYLQARVTASIFGAGVNENARDTRPIVDAVVTLGKARSRTTSTGVARIRLASSSRQRDLLLRVTAGATFAATQRLIRVDVAR